MLIQKKFSNLKKKNSCHYNNLPFIFECFHDTPSDARKHRESTESESRQTTKTSFFFFFFFFFFLELWLPLPRVRMGTNHLATKCNIITQDCWYNWCAGSVWRETGLVNDSSASTAYIYWGQTCCSVIDGKLQLLWSNFSSSIHLLLKPEKGTWTH